MKLLKHILNQPFIAATGLAALAHSTWSLGTLFAGPEPAQGSPAWFAWLLPALLIAFSLDVGQITTSAEIRAGDRRRAKYATFAVLAMATYFLQWIYIAHHMPLLALAPGVRETWGGFATLVRDSALWVIPGLLPLSTLLYTFSTGSEALINRSPVNNLLLEAKTEYPVHCEHCEWQGTYTAEVSARNALSAHMARCKARLEASSNGH